VIKSYDVISEKETRWAEIWEK